MLVDNYFLFQENKVNNLKMWYKSVAGDRTLNRIWQHTVPTTLFNHYGLLTTYGDMDPVMNQ